MLKKYFLLNASIGVTAQANNLFNYPNKQLSFLKARFKELAILYAAIKTIFTYKDFKVKVMFDSDAEYSFYISNLSIIKNPNISGNLSYPVKADYQNGMFDVFLAHSMIKIKLIKLLLSLTKKKFPLNDKSKHYKTSRLTLKASDDFLVEFDGEIIKTNYTEFTILNKYLNVCVN